MNRVGFAKSDNMQALLEGIFSFVNFATNNGRKPNEIPEESTENKPSQPAADMTAPIDDNLLLSLQPGTNPGGVPAEDEAIKEKIEPEDEIGSVESNRVLENHGSEKAGKESESDSLPEGEENDSEVAEDKPVIKRGRKKLERNKNNNPNRDWNESDDKLLRSLVIQYKNDWKKIARRIFSLTGLRRSASHLKNYFKDIKETCPQKQVRFTDSEDKTLVDMIKQHGMKWSLIAKEFPGRDPISLKNRYYSHIRKKVQPAPEPVLEKPIEPKVKVPETILTKVIKEPIILEAPIDTRPKFTFMHDNLANLNMALNAQALMGRDFTGYYPFFNQLALKAFENPWNLTANVFRGPIDQSKLNLHK